MRRLLLAAVATGTLGAPAPGTAEDATVPAHSRQRELIKLLHQDCGACHGMRLAGGLGPPLTPQALKGKPTESLVATIVSGRVGTAMPPWRPFLSEAEARWLVTRLQRGETHAP